MTGNPYAPAVLNDVQRDYVIQVLSAAFASDRLSLEQLDDRLAAVYQARALPELEVLLADPANAMRSLAEEVPTSHTVSESVVPARGAVMAVMGGYERKGAWVVPRHLRVVAVMGGGELDLRQAKFGEGVTEIEIFAMWGGVEITVPSGVRVEASGMAIMGGFSISGATSVVDPNAPLLRVSGLAIMGGVEVKEKTKAKEMEKRFRHALERAQKLRARSGI